MLFLVSTSPVQSLSVYPTSSTTLLVEKKSPSWYVPFIYLNIRLAAIQWDIFGSYMNRLNNPTPKELSGLVATKYLKLPIKLLNVVTFTFLPCASLDSFTLSATGVKIGFDSVVWNLFNIHMQISAVRWKFHYPFVLSQDQDNDTLASYLSFQICCIMLS